MLILTAFLFNLGYLVDVPATYVSPRGSYDLEFRIGDIGMVSGKIGVSPLEGFMFGISYGGTKILGSGTPEYHSSPGVQAKWGMAASGYSLGFGYDSESYGDLPVGVYAVVGGDLRWKLIPYVGVGYYNDLKPFGGVEAGLLEVISLSFEGCVEDTNFIGNCGIRWTIEQQIILEFNLKDIFGGQPVRAIKFSYQGYI
jgi:hypothetical protein